MNQIDVMKHVVMLLRDGPDNHVQEAVDLLCQAIEQAEKVEPVGSVVEDDNDFGRVKALLDQDARVQLAVGTKLYLHPPTAPAEIDFLQHDDHLRFIQRVLESDSPKSDRDEAAQMVRDIRRSIRPIAPAQRPLTRAEKNRIWSSCSGAATLPARASLFGTKIEAVHGIKGASL